MKTQTACFAYVFSIVLLLVCRGALLAQVSETDGRQPRSVRSASERDDLSADEKNKLRWREGKRLIDHAGHFRQDGEGAVFISETGHELIALENLNLERVTRTLKASDESESIRWSVNGTVTEFNGRNYLQIQRAVYKSASPPPVPEQILN